jgi:outer membrane protein TolC
MSFSCKTRIKSLAKASAGLSLLAFSQMPAQSNEIQLENRDTPTNPSEKSTSLQNTELDSDQLVKKLEQLQSEVKTKSIAVSIEDAIALGIKNNPELEIAFQDIQSLEWQLISAQRKWYPTLNLYGGQPFSGYQWSTFVQNYAPMPTDLGAEKGTNSKQKKRSKTYTTQANASARWNFFDLSRQADINAAAESLKKQKLLFNVTARSLVLEIQKNYYALQSSAQLINSFNTIYAINKQRLRELSERQSIGMVTVLDVEQTKSQLFLDLNELIKYTESYIAQAGRLAEKLALSPGRLAVPNEEAKPQGIWAQDLEQTIEEALRQREEIPAAIANAEAQEWQGIAALRKYLPVFSLQATGRLTGINGYTNIPANTNISNQTKDTQQWDASIGIGFEWPLFDGGQNAARAQSQFALSKKFLATASKTKLQVTQEVQTSYSEMQTARIGMASAEQAYRSAEIAQEAARARFDIGVGDIVGVVQAIGLLSRAATQKSQSILQYNTAIAELYRYSANWPMDSENNVDQRIKTNKQTTQP